MRSLLSYVPLDLSHSDPDIPTPSVWALHYVFPNPVAPRVFMQLLIKHMDDSDPSHRVGYLIQLPVDLDDSNSAAAIQGKSIRARYCSVESLIEGDDGKVEWR